MEPEIEVRTATEGDAKELHKLASELADAVGDPKPEPEAVRKRLLELLESAAAHTLVAESDAGLAGAASVWIKPDLAHGDTTAEVPMLVVSEELRRSGVGKLLMHEVRQLASDNGANLIELVATADNVPAREFYKALGFVETEHVALEFLGDLEDPPDSEDQ
ncbi:MAG: GNAT family N-acetyltransferase [Rubrobacteraceae bacterium]